MWMRYLITILFFYFFALLQSSFFAHFGLFGAVPNLVFIFFFLLIFFSAPPNFAPIIVYAFTAGFFSDIIFDSHFGVSIILFLIAGFLINKVQVSLNETKGRHPIVYFIPVFLIFFTAYQALLALYFKAPLDYKFLYELLYNLIIAAAGFYIFKKFGKLNIAPNVKQLKLFK